MKVISAGRFLLFLLFVSSVVSAWIQFGVYHSQVNVITLAEVIGGILGLMLVPVLVVVPWRSFQSRAGHRTDAPLMTAAFIFSIIVIGVITGAMMN